MVTCQSANQLKTAAKVSWAFKMVSQFGSLGYTITGKTADPTVVQKTIIDTLHKEGKPQTFIAKGADCSQSAVSKHVNRKLTGFGTCPHCQKHQKLVKWPTVKLVCLTGQQTHPVLKAIAWIYGVLSRGKWETRDQKNADELKATVKKTWASITPQQCHKLITSMPRRIEAVIKAKGAPTKYWVHIQ